MLICKILHPIFLAFILEKIFLKNYYTCYFSYYYFLILLILAFFVNLIIAITSNNRPTNFQWKFFFCFGILLFLWSIIGFFGFLFQLYNGSLCFNFSDKFFIYVFYLTFTISFSIFIYFLYYCYFRRPFRNIPSFRKKTKIGFEKNLLKIYKMNIIDKKEIEVFIKQNKKYINIFRRISKKEKELIKIYFSETEFKKGESCLICFEEFENNKNIINLDKKTRNLYHYNCIISWFKKKFCCPIKRKAGILILLETLKEL